MWNWRTLMMASRIFGQVLMAIQIYQRMSHHFVPARRYEESPEAIVRKAQRLVASGGVSPKMVKELNDCCAMYLSRIESGASKELSLR